MKDFSSTLRLETLVENTGADKQSARFLSTAVIKHRQSRLICLTVPGGRARRKLKAVPQRVPPTVKSRGNACMQTRLSCWPGSSCDLLSLNPPQRPEFTDTYLLLAFYQPQVLLTLEHQALYPLTSPKRIFVEQLIHSGL